MQHLTSAMEAEWDSQSFPNAELANMDPVMAITMLGKVFFIVILVSRSWPKAFNMPSSFEISEPDFLTGS